MTISVAIAIALLASNPTDGLADELEPDSAAELDHSVSATVQDDLATLRVERRLVNRSDKSQTITLRVELPTNAVMKRLSILDDDGSWSAATLVESAKIRSVRPVKNPGVAAVATVRFHKDIEIDLFPIAPRAEVSIRYELETVMFRRSGRSQFVYPSAADGMSPVAMKVSVDKSADGPTLSPALVIIDGHAGSPNRVLDRYVGDFFTPKEAVVTIPVTVPVGVVTAHADTHITVFASLPDGEATTIALVNPAGRVQRISPSSLSEERSIAVLPELLDPGESVGRWSLQLAAVDETSKAIIHRWALHSGGKTVKSTAPAQQLPSIESVDETRAAWPSIRSSERRIEIASVGGASKPRLRGRFSTLMIDANRAISRLHLEAPTRLSEMPSELRVVFILDLSKSRDESDVKRDLAIIDEYLVKTPDTRVELVMFSRFAHRLFGSFVSAREAAMRIKALTDEQLKPKNGSNVLGAALVARRALATEPGNRRVVLFSDGLMNTSFAIAPVVSAFAFAKGGADRRPAPILHVVDTGNGNDGFNPGHALAPLAVTFGGSSESISSDRGEPGFGRGVLGLIRPIRFDAVALSGPMKLNAQIPTSIEEGESIRLSHIGESQTNTLITSVSARLWQKPVTLNLRSTDRGQLASAFAFGASHSYDRPLKSLTEPQRTRLAFRGGVVSKSTSLVVTRSNTTMPVNNRAGGFHMSSTSCGCAGIIVHSVGPSLGEFSEPIKKCATDGAIPSSSFSVETSEDEIVAVKVESTDDRFGRCLTEGLWAHDLKSSYGSSTRKHDFVLSSVQGSSRQAGVSSRVP